MNENEFEAWRSRNVKNVGKGGKRPVFDPYNKALKGKERNVRAEEYPYSDVEGYHHYSERLDLKGEKEERKDDTSRSDEGSKRSKSGGSGSAPGQFLRNIIPKVVAVTASAVVLVSGYEAMLAAEVAEAKWNWSEDNKTAIVRLLDGNGETVKEIPAEITVAEVAPTCVREGSTTYTAVLEEGGKSYSDAQSVVISPTGHSLHVVSEEKLADGSTKTEYECEHCHEKFTVTVGESEE